MRSKARRSNCQNTLNANSMAPHSIGARRADCLADAIKPVFEQLESRRMLSGNPNTVYVNDNWVVTTNQGAPTLDNGDTVANSEDDGSLTGLTYGTNAFGSISSAESYISANPGAGITTVHVVSGTYSTQTGITISNLILEGDNAGVNPASGSPRAHAESILNAQDGSLVISASNVTVDGLTIEDARSGDGIGISVTTGGDNAIIRNNIVTLNSTGVQVGTGVGGVTVSNNLVSSNNQFGTNRGQGVRVDGASNVAITGNEFTGQAAGPTGTLAGAVTLNDATNVSIGNTTTGNTFDNNSVAIRIQGATTGTTIDNDNFNSGTTRNTTDVLDQATGAGSISAMQSDTFAASSTYIDYSGSDELNATNSGNTFGGVTANSSATDLAHEYAIVDKITDGVDSTGRGLVRINPQQIYVTIATETANLGAIQRAVGLAVAGDTIHVQAGTYKENITVTKAITLLGANTGVAGSATRGAETVIQTNGNQNAVVTISSSGATVDGFTIDGDDPTVSGASLTSGDDTNVLYGVRPSGAFSNLTIANNIIKHADIGFRGDGSASGNSISRNWFDSIGVYDFGYAVSLRTNFYADVTNNLMTRVQDGLHTNNFSGAGPASFEFSGNTVQTYGAGVWDNLQYNGATSLKIDNNTISSLVAPTTPANAAVRAAYDNQTVGILLVSIQDNVGATITNNNISGMAYGVTAFNTTTANTITLGSTNSIHDNTVGVFVTNIVDSNPVSRTELGGDPSNVPAGFSGPNNPTGTATLALGGLTLAGNTTGVLVRGDNAFTTFGATATLQSGVTISGGTTGLAVKGAAANLSGDTLANTAFTGQTGNYITLSSGALHGHEINATSASFDSKTGATATDAQNYAIEDKITHAVDDSTLGFVRVKAANVFVTPNSFNSPTTTAPSVQRGVDAASDGDTVNIEDGTYPGQVEVAKSITLLGQSQANTIIQATSNMPAGFSTSSTNHPVVYIHNTTASVKNLTVDGNGQGGGANNRIEGIGMHNAAGTIDHVTVEHVRQNPLNGVQEGVAVYVINDDSASRSVNLTNSTLFDYQKNGTVFDGAGLNITVTGNTVTGAGATTQIAQNGIQVGDGATGTISGNTVSGNEYSGASSGSDPLNDVQSVGLLLFNTSGLQVTGNTVDGNDVGIYNNTDGATISGNHLGDTVANRYEGIVEDQGSSTISTNTIKGGNVGILLVSFNATDNGTTANSTASVTGNTITNSTTALQLADDATHVDAFHPSLSAFTGNTITGSSVYIENDDANAVNATGSNTFDGINPSSGSTTTSQYYTLSSKTLDALDNPDNGLVRYKNGNVYVSSADTSIQGGIDAAGSGDVIHIQAGTYAGNVNASAKTLTLDPGDGPVTATINGDLILGSTDTLHMEIDGTGAGSSDQLVVNGTVTLGGATLDTSGSTITATPGQSIELINNNGSSDPISGTFAAPADANGNVVIVNSQPFFVFYNEGNGNDVTLTRAPDGTTAGPPPAPTVVYVDDNWVGVSNGTDADGSGDAFGNGTAKGYDEFDNIQAAVNAVAPGGTVKVRDGTYNQSNITVSKAVTITGQSRAGVLVGPSIADAHADSSTSGPISNGFLIDSSDVSIEHLTIDGNQNNIARWVAAKTTEARLSPISTAVTSATLM